MALDPATHKTPEKVVNAWLAKGSAKPSTRQGWHEFYVAMYNKYERELLATLACWHQLLFLAFGETPMSEINEQTKKELAEEAKRNKPPSMFARMKKDSNINDSWGS